MTNNNIQKSNSDKHKWAHKWLLDKNYTDEIWVAMYLHFNAARDGIKLPKKVISLLTDLYEDKMNGHYPNEKTPFLMVACDKKG